MQGLKAFAPADRPHQIGLIYYAFRIMIAIGFFLAALMLWSVWQWLRGKLADDTIGKQKWLMRAWIFAAPLGYIATDSGWIVRCVGQQPLTVYGEIRTINTASHIPSETVFTSLIGFVALYSLLFITTLYFGRRIIWTLLLFLLSFIGIGLIVFPYIIPTKITIYQGAASPSALVFMLIFVGFLIPIMLFYDIYQYVVFRGKVSSAKYGE